MANRPVFNNNKQRKVSTGLGSGSILAAKIMAMFGLGKAHQSPISKPAYVRKPRTDWKRHKNLGVGERARRVRQIAKGMLNYENGLRRNDCVVGSPTGQKIFDTPQQAMFYVESD
jgi:hypothetical protein